ncbi:beta-glucosidase (plasmid) [Novosphingobium resinovorum]|uniref:beta-glucosidase n=1 Tax=Novosphingobium resinovorum TaxID=158500 RepID=A0A1D8AFE4_9SPHN|nr:beta-glucosidase [Novosphingobium resinovorum]
MISTRHRLLLASTATLVALAGTSKAEVLPRQPSVEAHRKPVLKIDGLRFHDLDGDGKLTPYEDWRLSPEKRADDLVARMTLAEKAGTMMHGTLPGAGGALGRSDSGYDLDRAAAMIRERHVTSMITRLVLPPARMAAQDNAVQELAEATRLGVPVTISSDPRNHFQNVVGASENAAGTTQWPETLGLAALRDPALVERFATIVRSEYRAVGIHQALSPQLDIATEPRWSRITGTFGSDPALTSTLGAAYVRGFQGGAHGLANDGVMTVVKHWVGYGASIDGLDGHNSYGRFARVGDKLNLHVQAFHGALDAGASAVMPAYTTLPGAIVDGQPVEPVSAGYSKVLLTNLLRGKLGYKGIILSDWAITLDCDTRCSAPNKDAPQRPEDISTAWGVEDLSVEDRYALGVTAGIDQFGGTDAVEPLLAAVRNGKITEARIDQSVRRILISKFQLGLFENAYVDPAGAGTVVGAARPEAEATQRAAQVLLQNHGLIPILTKRKVWLLGMSAQAAQAAGLEVVGDPAEADFAVIRADTAHEMLHPYHFFGSRQHEGRLDYRDGDAAYEALKRATAAGTPTLFSIFMDRPAILTNVQDKAAAILVNFGASDAAVLDVALGKATARGRLPFELPRSMAAVEAQDPALPDDSVRPLYPYGSGIITRPLSR